MALSPPISVVVPAFNAARTISRCLAALERQTLGRDRYELLVVDDASTDGTGDIARACGARVVSLDRTSGPGGARNAGIHAARGRIMVFTDADCEPCPDFLELLVRPLLHEPGVGATKGTYLTRQASLVARFVQVEYEERYRRMRRQEWIDFVDTYAACFRREDLLRVGGFDTRLRQCQDQELSFRLAADGVRIRFVEQARTYHLHADRLGSYLRKKYRIAWWKVAVLRRHPQKLISDSHTPQGLKLEMAAAAMTAGVAAAALPASIVLGAAGGPAGLAGWIMLTPLPPALIFLLLASPFTVRALRRDPAVGAVAPGFLFLRGLVLAAGLIVGIVRPLSAERHANDHTNDHTTRPRLQDAFTASN